MFFWLFCALFWLVIPRIRLLFEKRESYRLILVNVGFFVAGMSVLFWFIQLWAGLPESPLPFKWPSPQRWFGLGLTVFGWLMAIWWIFQRNGAESIAEAISTNPVFVKAVVVLLVVVGVASSGISYKLW